LPSSGEPTQSVPAQSKRFGFWRWQRGDGGLTRVLTFLAFAACWVLDFVRRRFDSSGEVLAYMAGAAA
jgi:hypothetical protein